MGPRRWCAILAGCLYFSCALAGETGMSETGAINPAPPPPDATRGGGTMPPPLQTNTTPAVGIAPQSGGVPSHEVQPGVETPQLENPSGQRLGGRPHAGTRSSGDEDDIDDLEIERHRVRDVDTPGPPSKGPSAVQRSGGDGTQTEDDLSVGRKATDGPLDAAKPSPAAALPNSSSRLPQRNESMTVPPRPALPGLVVVIPRQSCGTHWTGWVKDPNADVNPCPKGCERGKRLRLDEHKNGKATEYQANYECFLPKLEVPQPALRTRAAGAAPRRDCGTMWTGWQSDPKSAVNPCPANCERGDLRAVNRSLSNGKLVYDMNYRCYFKQPEASKQAAAQAKVITTTKIEISGPTPKVIRTAAIQLSGPATKIIRTSSIQLSGPVTKVIRTATLQLSGPAPKAIRTGTIQLIGPTPKAVTTSKIEITGFQ